MSHYFSILTKIVDESCLVKALNSMNYETVEVHSEAQSLYGYKGDVRPQKAHVIVRRKYISDLSNDIGFVKTEAGTYEAIVSEFDQELLGANWVNEVCQAYSYFVVTEKLAMQGFKVDEKFIDPETKKVHLVLKR